MGGYFIGNPPTSEGGGTTNHSELTNRADAEQHPQSAITGLVADLGAKATLDYVDGQDIRTQTLKNKTIVDYTNLVHADAVHERAKATETILKGQAVRITGYNSGEDALEVALVNQDTFQVSTGIAKSDIAVGEFGQVISNGVLTDTDTNTWNEGEILYTSTNGDLTNIEPSTGISQPIAYVLRSNTTNGALLINATNPKYGNLGWKDNISPFISATGNAINEPSWEDIGNGIVLPRFTTGEHLPAPYHQNHDVALGTKSYPHLHFLSDTVEAVGTTVVWRFGYVNAKGRTKNEAGAVVQGESLTVPLINMDISYTYDGAEVAGEHIIVECTDLQAFDAGEPDTYTLADITLLNTTANGKIFGIGTDLHYQSNRENTPYKSPNFFVQ